ncbi:MAG: hypothetical protein AB1791_20690 [Chloroflexota bacterium]
MNRNIWIIVAVVLGIALFAGGIVYGQSRLNTAGLWPGMMGNLSPTNQAAAGMMQSNMMGQGMMSGGMTGQGMMNGNMMGQGMMQSGMMGQGMMQGDMMGQGMMGGPSGGLYQTDPITIDQARTAVSDYLAGQTNAADLKIAEVMIFDNHAYVEVVETSTGVGAYELLVDPITLGVTPEHGPNMMWNTKYGQMTQMMGGSTVGPSAEMPVSAEEAIAAAQAYLDNYLPGRTAADEADTFYGYYTIHVLRDGQVVGMVSVNGYTRQVFPHQWHGNLVEMSE